MLQDEKITIINGPAVIWQHTCPDLKTIFQDKYLNNAFLSKKQSDIEKLFVPGRKCFDRDEISSLPFYQEGAVGRKDLEVIGDCILVGLLKILVEPPKRLIDLESLIYNYLTMLVSTGQLHNAFFAAYKIGQHLESKGLDKSESWKLYAKHLDPPLESTNKTTFRLFHEIYMIYECYVDLYDHFYEMGNNHIFCQSIDSLVEELDYAVKLIEQSNRSA